MRSLAVSGLLVVTVIAALSAVTSGASYYKGHEKVKELHDPCEHFVCTTGKDGRRTFCRVAHVCDKQGDEFTCNFTLPVCVNRAGKDSYYDYEPETSVCKKNRGSPVIHLGSGEDKECNGTMDCPMGYECVDPEYGEPTDEEGVCCLAEIEMKKPPTCPKIDPKKSRKRKSSRYGYGGYGYKPINVCMTKCYTNYDCDYGEICCYTGCGYKCIDVITTTTSTTTTTTPAPTTSAPAPVTPTSAPSPTSPSPPVSPFLASSTAGGGGSGGSGGAVTETTAAPNGEPFSVADLVPNPSCPLDSKDVICDQILCETDADCADDEVCCDSKTCNNQYMPGSKCLKLRKKKKPTKKRPTKKSFPGFIGKPSFGGFGYESPPSSNYFGGSPKRGYKDEDDSYDPYFPKFPTLYKNYDDHEDDRHDSNPYGFSSSSNNFVYDKRSPFKSSRPFSSMYGKDERNGGSYEPTPNFGYGYKSKRNSHSEGEYEDEGDMYGEDEEYYRRN